MNWLEQLQMIRDWGEWLVTVVGGERWVRAGELAGGQNGCWVARAMLGGESWGGLAGTVIGGKMG